MKRKLLLMASVLTVMTGSTMVFATEAPSNEDLVTVTEEASVEEEVTNEEVEFPEEDRVYLEEGVWMEGDMIVVDVSQLESTPVEMETDMYNESVDPYGAGMPPQSNTWDWSDGSYSASFSTNTASSGGGTYTLYNFIGSGTYYVDIQASRDNHNSGLYNYTVQLMTYSTIGDYGNIYQSFNIPDERWHTVKFTNCDPDTKYAVQVLKAADGTTLSGNLEVYI